MRNREDITREIRRLRDAGVPRATIAERLGVSDYRVIEALDGLPPRHEGLRARAKDDLRAEALRLREEGLTYDQIAAKLGASKGSLSLWCRNLPRRQPEREEVLAHVRTMHEARRAKRDRLVAATRAAASAEIGDITDRELLLMGAVAYWCEGSKSKPWRRSERITFINSDIGLVRLFMAWLRVCGVASEQLNFRVSIHESADVAAAESFWADVVGVPVADFRTASLKRHNPRSKEAGPGLLRLSDYRCCSQC